MIDNENCNQLFTLFLSATFISTASLKFGQDLSTTKFKSFFFLLDDLTIPIKLDFGEPGTNVQKGFHKLGLADGEGGNFTGTFPCYTHQCTIKIQGYTHTKSSSAIVRHGEPYHELSNLLRSGFIRTREAGVMRVEVGGFSPWSLLQVKTYHYAGKAHAGVEFALQYQGEMVCNRFFMSSIQLHATKLMPNSLI